MSTEYERMAVDTADTEKSSSRSTIRRWVLYFLGVGVLLIGTLLAMGVWVAVGNPSGAMLGLVAVAVIVIGHLFARKMGVAR